MIYGNLCINFHVYEDNGAVDNVDNINVMMIWRCCTRLLLHQPGVELNRVITVRPGSDIYKSICISTFLAAGCAPAHSSDFGITNLVAGARHPHRERGTDGAVTNINSGCVKIQSYIERCVDGK